MLIAKLPDRKMAVTTKPNANVVLLWGQATVK